MGRAWLFSSVLHTALAVLLYFGLPSLTRPPPAMERAVTVELVSATELAPPAPELAATAPEPERAAATPEPSPPPPPAPKPEPEPEPEPEPVDAPAPEPEPAVEPEVARAATPAPPRPAPPTPKPFLKPPLPQVAAAKPPPAPTPEPPPATRPEPPKEDAFAALLKSVEQLDRREQGETVQAGRGRGQTAAGQAQRVLGEAQLSFGEIDALKRQINLCWALPVSLEGIADMVVQLRIQVRPDRTVQSVTIEDQSRLGRDPIFRAVAESARRAVDKCSPLNLPPGKYALWRDIVMNFYPADAING